jgi:hypothetical protein
MAITISVSIPPMVTAPARFPAQRRLSVGNRRSEKMAVAPGHCRRRCEGDERAAVSVARRHELARNVRAEQLDAGGVDAIGDLERAAQPTVGVAHLAFLGRPEGDILQVDLIASAEPANGCVEARRCVEHKRAGAAAYETHANLVAAARDLHRAVEYPHRGGGARLDDFAAAARGDGRPSGGSPIGAAQRPRCCFGSQPKGSVQEPSQLNTIVFSAA